MSLEDEIIQYVSGKLIIDKDKLSRNSKFTEDLAMDSLDMVDMVMDIEQRYGVNIPDQEFGKMRKLGDIIDYVRERYRGDDETGVKAKL